MSTTTPDVTFRATTWDAFLETSRRDIGFKQSTWWADFLGTRGWENFGVALRESDVTVGGANVLRKEISTGKCFYYMPHGPVLPQNDDGSGEAFEAILSFIDEERKADLDSYRPEARSINGRPSGDFSASRSFGPARFQCRSSGVLEFHSRGRRCDKGEVPHRRSLA